MCARGRERFKQEKFESAHLATISQENANKKRKRNNKGKKITVGRTSQPKRQQKQDNVINHFFCKKVCHMNNECPKYANWHIKKGKLLNFVCSEVNLALVPNDTWWIDIGATTHVSVTMQGCLRSGVSTDAERYIYVGNGNMVAVEGIGIFRLYLGTGLY